MRITIPAVHKQKLEDFLKGLEMWEPLLKGELRCGVCGTIISIDNIGFVIPSGKDILLCCSSTECIYKIKKLRKGESKNES